MNSTEPLRPNAPEIPQEKPEEKTPEDLGVAQKEIPPLEEKPETSKEEMPAEMVIEEPGTMPIENQETPTPSRDVSLVIKESDVSDIPVNTTDQAYRLEKAINNLQR